MVLAVILPGIAVGNNLQFLGRLSDFQLAVHVGNGVVRGDVFSAVHYNSLRSYVIDRTNISDGAFNNYRLNRIAFRNTNRRSILPAIIG